MTELDPQYRRWTELMDRSAAGEMLTPEELAFCERYAAQNPACQSETELLDALADLDAAPTAQSRALVDRTLAQLAEENAQRARYAPSRNPDARLPRVMWAIGGAAAAAFGLAIATVAKQPAQERSATATVAEPSSARVELVYSSGAVSIDGKPVAGHGLLLSEGARIAVGQGTACLAMDPEIDVCIAAGSELALSRTNGPARRVDVMRGKVGVQLAPQPEGSRFSVVADGMWSTAVGTAFTVERDAAHGSRTTVMHGRVRVGRNDKNDQLVSAHQRAELRNGRASVAAIGRSEESAEWALLQPARLWRSPVSATLITRGEPEGAAVVLDEQLIGIAPLSTLVPAGSHRIEIRKDGRTLLSSQVVAEVGRVSTVNYRDEAADAVVELPAAEALEPPPSTTAGRSKSRARSSVTAALRGSAPKSPAEMLTEAHRLMRSQSFEQAARQYQALRERFPRSPEAHAVLVSLAELELDQLGQPAQALEHLEKYLATRGGPLTEEARQARIRSLRALGEDRREAEAIADFLAAYPRSFRAPALQRRLAELETSR